MNRKDDHIHFALKQSIVHNDFDHVRFVPNSIPSVDVEAVDISTTLFDRTFPYPIYINAMTGGTEQAYTINKKLALIAKHFNFMIASGSLSSAIKDPSTKETFQVLRETFPKGFIVANIGISAPLENAKKAIELLNADAIQIHINAPQEIIMPEGDRVFSNWASNLAYHATHSVVPVIAKETGFGMSLETLKKIKHAGIKTVDLSGTGGTNFIAIENNRRPMPLRSFESYGFSTVESLLEAKKIDGLTILASGGIRDAFDVVKALALGASMVGLSGFFLKLVTSTPIDDAITIITEFLEDIKKIMAILDAKTIHDLRSKRLLFSEKLKPFLENN